MLLVLSAGLLGACGVHRSSGGAQTGLPSPSASPPWAISEILIVPARGSAGPWVELANTGATTACFHGAWEVADGEKVLRRMPARGCVPGGGHLVVGDVSEGIQSVQERPVGWGALPYPIGRLALREGGRLLAEVAWGPNTDVGPVRRGFANARPPRVATASSWCTIWGERYDGFNTGTPGAPFLGCETCLDPDTQQMRSSAAVVPGALSVDALWAKVPPPRRGRQSITLHNRGQVPLDLVDLELMVEPSHGRSRSWRLMGLGCLPLAPQTACRVGVGQLLEGVEPEGGMPGFFSGPLLPVGDQIITLRQRATVIFRGLVAHPRQGPSRPWRL